MLLARAPIPFKSTPPPRSGFGHWFCLRRFISAALPPARISDFSIFLSQLPQSGPPRSSPSPCPNPAKPLCSWWGSMGTIVAEESNRFPSPPLPTPRVAGVGAATTAAMSPLLSQSGLMCWDHQPELKSQVSPPRVPPEGGCPVPPHMGLVPCPGAGFFLAAAGYQNP